MPRGCFFVFRTEGGAAGAFTTHMDDILGCGEPDAPPPIGAFFEYRFGATKMQETPSVHASMKLLQGGRLFGKVDTGSLHAESATLSHLCGTLGGETENIATRRY